MTLLEMDLNRKNISSWQLNFSTVIIMINDQLGKDSIYITTAKFLININAGHLAETSLSRVSFTGFCNLIGIVS